MARGFTLIEMLVVISIITILAGLILGALWKARQTAKEQGTATTLKLLGAALQSYELSFQDYPPSEGDPDGIKGSETLFQCLRTEKKDGPYIQSADVKVCDFNNNRELEIADEWNQPIRYLHHRDYGSKNPLKHTYRLISAGPNRVFEDGRKGSDDIVNWNKAVPDQ